MKTSKKIAVCIMGIMLCIAVGYIAYAQVNSADSEKTVLRMAHCQAEDSLVAKSVAELSGILTSDESMQLDVQIYTSGVLGGERDLIELVKAGILDMAKVSSNALDQFNNLYGIFGLPYIFQSVPHYYNAMDNSEEIQKLFMSNYEEGFLAVGWYASGSRNIYTKAEGPALTPADLKGKKFRVQQSATAMQMIELMGGSPVPMSAGETYTALQQNIIDGAENTELALTVDKHEELVKSYTYTEHQYSPDIYIISSAAWDKLSEEQQKYLKDSFILLNENYKGMYDAMIAEAVEEAESMGVTFYRDIDKTAFIEAVQPIHENFKARGKVYEDCYTDIQKYVEVAE